MFQIRLHGRGGQGVVTAAEMLALAGFMEGHKAQAFPSFGSERTGAPVVAFARLSSVEIRLREPIQEPESLGRPLPGAGMLAGFAAITGSMKLESVQKAYAVKFAGRIAEANAEIARLAYEAVLSQKEKIHA